mgnify:CR=1 FL=1
MIFYTDHAQIRMAQRNLKDEEILFIIEHGKPIYKAGVVFFQMWQKRLPNFIKPNDRLANLAGTTVVACCDGEGCYLVITVYRDPKSFKKDRAKKEYNWNKTAEEWIA